MAIRYVNNSGVNSGSGTIGSPWQTETYAQNNAVSGDTILVQAGKTVSPFSINKSNIIWGTYGGSAKAVVDGFTTLTGWVNQGGGIWSSTNATLGSTLKKVTLNGIAQNPGRSVKFNETDHGYLTVSNGTTTSLTNTVIGSGPNFVGGQLTLKSSLYTVDILNITGQSGNTLTFSGALSYGAAKNGYGFVISNHINTLTQFGEWSYNAGTKTVYMYFGANNPSSYTIRASRYTNCISSGGGINNVQFNNFIFEGSNGDAVNVDGANTFTFNNCFFRQAGRDGLSAKNHPNLTVNYSDFYEINNNGCYTSVGSSNATLYKCRAWNIGLDITLTVGGVSAGGGYGFHVPWGGTNITYCTVYDVAGIGIRFEKAFSKCNYNHVYNVLKRFADLGGIYNWNSSTNLDHHPGMECIGNHVHDIVSNTQGTTYSIPMAMGIYHDDHSAGAPGSLMKVYDNVVWNIGGNGFNFRSPEYIDIKRNISFNCDVALKIVNDQGVSGEKTEALIVQNNIFVARDATKDILGLYDNASNLFNWTATTNGGSPVPANWNNNVIARPITNDTGNAIKTQNSGSIVSRTIAGYKTYLGWDANSTGSPVAITSTDQFRLETNYSDTPLTVDLSDGSYVDMYGVEQPLSKNLQPYEGVLLIKTSDTPSNEGGGYTALKQVYVNGFAINQTQDASTTIPFPIDILNSVQYPVGQNLSDFNWWEPSLKPTLTSNGSAWFRGDINHPTHTTTVTTVRIEATSTNPLLRASTETWWSISFYTPLDQEPDPKHETIQQWHQLGGSPSFSINRRSGFYRIQIFTGSSTQQSQQFGAGPCVPGEWVHFVCRAIWADDLSGRLTVWKNGQLCRLNNPSGTPWVVPNLGEVSGISDDWPLKAALGDLPYTVNDGSGEVSVLDWYGFTSREGDGTSPEKIVKWGIYKSGITSSYFTGGGLRPGWDDPESQYYIPPVSRITEIGITNVNIEIRTNELSHEYIFKSLDIDNNDPLETPVWWVGEEPEPDIPPMITLVTPVNNRMIIYPTTLTLTVDITEGTNAIDEVEYFVNGSSIAIVTSAPWSYEWVNPTAGIKDITAVVRDTETLSATSNEVTIIIYNFIDGEGDFRMFLNEGTSNTEDYGGETFVGALNFYQEQSLIDTVSPDTLEPIFLTGRAWFNLNYAIPVPNGTYTVKTYHNEPYWGVNDGQAPGPNKRVFDIFLEGNLVYDNFDIYVVNNSENTILTFNDVVVSDGMLHLDMVASVDMANLSALSIEPYTLPNQAPVAVATSDITSGDEPLEVNFTGNTSTDDNGIVSYLWNFDDGNTASTANATHTFVNPGEYTVTLTITDVDGLTDIDTIIINVNDVIPVNNPPVAIANSDITSGDFPLTVSFNGSTSTDDVGIVSYEWDFQDGSTSDNVNVLHTFDSIGVYEVTLTVTDAGGLSDVDTITITVTGPIFEPPTIDIISPSNAEVFLEGDIIDFIVSADDDNEQITSVKFYVNDIEVDEVFNEPYSIDLNLLEGDYELYAEAFNNDSSLIISDSINITVNKVVSDIIINSSTGGSSEVLTTPYNEAGQFAEDMVINIKATPSLGYTFSHWIIDLTVGNPQVVGTGELNYSFVMPANDVTITPVFNEPIEPDGSYFPIRGLFTLYPPS